MSAPLYAFKIFSSIIHVNIVQNIEAIFTDLLDSPGARASGFFWQKNARTSRAWGLFAGGFFRFPGHLRQEVVPFLQIGGGIFPQLLSHFWLLRIEATEALLLQQCLSQGI